MTLDEKIGQLSQINVRRYAEMVEVETAAGKFDTEPGLFSLYTGYADHLLHEQQFRLVK